MINTEVSAYSGDDVRLQKPNKMIKLFQKSPKYHAAKPYIRNIESISCQTRVVQQSHKGGRCPGYSHQWICSICGGEPAAKPVLPLFKRLPKRISSSYCVCILLRIKGDHLTPYAYVAPS